MKMLVLSLLVSGAIFGNSHDITTLPSWGPYSKNYAGVSKISDMSSGIRVDFSLMPGMYRRNICVPNLLFESGCHPWQVSPDMKVVTYRHELEWKDRVYVDASYHMLDDSTVLLEIHCVNATDVPQDITLHTMATLAKEENHPMFSSSSPYVAGKRYLSYEPLTRKHNHNLVYDGWFRGEVRDSQTLTGFAIKTAGEAGDRITYELGGYCGPVTLRYKTDAPVDVELDGRRLTLDSGGKYALADLGPCKNRVEICTAGDGAITIDALLLSANPEIVLSPVDMVPQVREDKGNYVIKYEADPLYYGVGWNYEDSDVIQYFSSDPDVFIREMVHNHVDKLVMGDMKGHFTSAFQRPVCLGPQKDTTIYNLIVCGSEDEVYRELAAFKADEASFVARAGSAGQQQEELLPGAEKYALTRQLFQATLLTNVVYPVYTQGEYIRHFAPGKHWNSLYTWDSGFISWGMADIDPMKAFEIIRAYTTEEGSQSAFIHHGTPLPIHFFAFSHLLGKTGDMDQLAFLYPRLKRFYEFACGHDANSSMMMDSGLVRTWDYFYNSGGWDDYPPQQDLRSHPERYASVAPVVSTAYYIRAAKILRQCAQRLSLKADEKMYDADIARMSKAIQEHAWDAESQYFGYVTHDGSGRPDGIYRYCDGVNFNMGLDGVSPLVAGICTGEQESMLVDHIFDPSRLWTKVGISTVDQSAPYYSHSGYWNGCVWMPHQLVLWKTMLDLGKPELAEKIAMTALDSWAFETGQTYQCYEHFMVESGRGKGWHNFSGLSSPVVNWFSAYFEPGTVSTGFDMMLCDPVMNRDCTEYSAKVIFDKDAAGRTASMLLCMNPSHNYAATLDGKALKIETTRAGLVQVSVPERIKPGIIRVFATNSSVRDLTVLPMSVSSTGAVLSWDNPKGTAEGDVYEVNVGGQTLRSDRTTLRLEGLESGKAYSAKVRLIPGGGKRAQAYCEAVSFQTLPKGEVLNILDFGAVRGGTDEIAPHNAAAIQKAIDACPEGGTVLIPEGEFISGAIFLKGDMCLELAQGAVLQGSGRPSDYPIIRNRFEGWELDTHASLINCGEMDRSKSHMTENVAVRGKGTIRGAGAELGREMMKVDGDFVRGRIRGRLIQFLNCRNVCLDGLTIENPPCWTVHTVYCENITCNELTLKSMGVRNGDGIDPDSSENFYIVGCIFENGDDCIAIKSGKNPEGNEVGLPSKGIYVSECDFRQGHGISIGSEISGGVEDIIVRECKAGPLKHGMQIKATRERGAYIRKVDVRDCDLQQITIFTRLSYNNDGAAAPFPPKFSDFSFRRLDMSSGVTEKPIIDLQSFPETEWKVENVLFQEIIVPENSRIRMEPAINVVIDRVLTPSGAEPQIENVCY